MSVVVHGPGNAEPVRLSARSMSTDMCDPGFRGLSVGAGQRFQRHQKVGRPIWVVSPAHGKCAVRLEFLRRKPHRAHV
eukprot:5438101-Prymnesium_polylepis.1